MLCRRMCNSKRSLLADTQGVLHQSQGGGLSIALDGFEFHDQLAALLRCANIKRSPALVDGQCRCRAEYAAALTVAGVGFVRLQRWDEQAELAK